MTLYQNSHKILIENVQGLSSMKLKRFLKLIFLVDLFFLSVSQVCTIKMWSDWQTDLEAFNLVRLKEMPSKK